MAFLVDGEAYFRVLAEASERARHAIRIVGWDIHSGIRLRRDGSPSDPLGAFLASLLSRRPELHVNILDWDFAMIYALEREPVPLVGRTWPNHPRLHFHFDGNHPPGASHHQKIVVVDDALAFVGGFDLAASRWDTSDHAARDPRRSDPGYAHYPPFHDVQMMVDGPAAAALGELVRDRWLRATGSRIPAVDGGDVWPPAVAPDLEDVPVAIARTEPAWQARPAVFEVEALYLAAIAAARRTIYCETQYLTAGRIAAALARRLGEADGPEVVMVVPRCCSGWLEEATMGVLRERVLRGLRAADRFGRLQVCHPVVPGAEVNVHAKVLVVDDEFLRIGSANASGRSMRFDTECDLAIEADGDPRVRDAIVRFRDRLVAEHLGVAARRVPEAVRAAGALGAAIAALRGGERTLRPLETRVAPLLEDIVPDADLIDPHTAPSRHSLAVQVLLGQLSGSARGFLVRAAAVLLGVLALAAAWRWTPVGAWLGWAAMRVRPVRTSPLIALFVILVFVGGGLLLVPMTGLIVGATLVLGGRLGFAYGLLGALASSGVTYALGRALAHERVRRLLGGVVYRVSPRLARRAMRAVATGRLVPIAPFTVVNLVAGAARVDFRSFALRTLLTLTPGVFLLALVADRFASAIRAPSALTIGTLLVVMLLLLFLGPVTRRRHWSPREWTAQPGEELG